MRAFVTGIGIISPAGMDAAEVMETIAGAKSRLSTLSLFPACGVSFHPVGQVAASFHPSDVPRTHAMALCAARQAMAGTHEPPDALILGTTTGGMLTTEGLLREGNTDPDRYALHAPGTVAEYVARATGCTGPVLTVSTACASGSTVAKVALDLIRSETSRTVLVIGADSLCRLTYFGFSLLQLIDPTGAKPLDRQRRGLSVAEAAAALLLKGCEAAPPGAWAELRGGGLSCDAHHVTSPLPDGAGAAAAMRACLRDAGIEPGQVDYVNLHGTGTLDNDAAEAEAVHGVFGDRIPDLSSTKGIYGHPLAAAGTVEAVIGTLCLRSGTVPATVGCSEPDPLLRLQPILHVKRRRLDVVLSNSFGFGGNNASIVLARPDLHSHDARKAAPRMGFRILGSACLTGAGDLEKTMAALGRAEACIGPVPEESLARYADRRSSRRQRRLPRLALALAHSAHVDSGLATPPHSIYFGTGLGALSETHAFLTRLFDTGERFSSPMDFVGSLHNSPAGQVAILFGSRGANITLTGTNVSFEQALYCASLPAHEGEGHVLCLGADEAHDAASPILDPSVAGSGELSDGGGALVLAPSADPECADIFPAFLGSSADGVDVMDTLVAELGGPTRIRARFRAVFAGIPPAVKDLARGQLTRFLSLSSFDGPAVDYRRILGQYATVSAAACVTAERCGRTGRLGPALSGGGEEISLDGKGILMLGLGPMVSAIAVHGRQQPGYHG